MKKKLAILAIFLSMITFRQSYAFDVNEGHTGFFIYGMGGFMDTGHDFNIRTGQTFSNSVEGAYGLGFGYNFTDWFAPELQFSYATATDGTPSGQAREHVLTTRLNFKISTSMAEDFFGGGNVRFYPYIKVGGMAHGLYVNAPAADDKVGAWGGGLSLGAGLEWNIKAFYFAIDVNNDFVWLQEERNNIAGVDTVIIEGGFDYQISVMGQIGVHF